MDDLEWCDHIVSDPGVLGGKPVLKGTRRSVEFVLELLAGRWDQGAIADSDPALTLERVRAVLSYAAETFRQECSYLLPPPARSA